MSFGYGIVGCGWVAAAHAWGATSLTDEDVSLVAVADTDQRRADELARQFEVPHVHADYRDLLADDVDAISICVPDFLHREVALAAAEAGVHVLCEKPLGLDTDQTGEMVQAFERAGLGLGLVMNHRYSPDNIRSKAAIRAGDLGRLLIGDVMHSSCLTGDPDGSSPWRGVRGRAAGGVLSLQAIHFLDLLLWFMGPAASVSAWTDTLVRNEDDYEDTASLSLKLRSGALATLITTNGAPITDDFTGTRIEVQGTDGFLSLEGDVLRLVHDGYTPPQVSLPKVPAGAEEILFGVGHVHEITDFIRAVRAGAAPPIPGNDGHHLTAVISAAYQSATEGRAIEIEDSIGGYADSSGESLLDQGAQENASAAG